MGYLSCNNQGDDLHLEKRTCSARPKLPKNLVGFLLSLLHNVQVVCIISLWILTFDLVRHLIQVKVIYLIVPLFILRYHHLSMREDDHLSSNC